MTTTEHAPDCLHDEPGVTICTCRRTSNWYDLDDDQPQQFDTREEERGER